MEFFKEKEKKNFKFTGKKNLTSVILDLSQKAFFVILLIILKFSFMLQSSVYFEIDFFLKWSHKTYFVTYSIFLKPMTNVDW